MTVPSDRHEHKTAPAKPGTEHPQPRSDAANDAAFYADAARLGLTAEEADRICSRLGRNPSREELAVCGALWSEHCSYKSSRPHLRRFHTKEDWVLQGPGENAGVYAINDHWAIAFKMESHNHPSYIEPYQGAATGVGGILRDVFCMGARPIASLNCLRFGEGNWNAHLLRRVVEGIADYGNSIGVPTVGGDTQFHLMYSQNILVNAFTAGLVHRERIFKGVLTDQPPTRQTPWPTAGKMGHPIDPELEHTLFPPEENVLIFFGSATGRDGVHGATMSSAEFSADSETLRPTVQVGDPFAEKVLLEATMALINSGMMVGLQDMGAAGLTSSSAEMAGRSGCGVAIDLSKVPLRAPGMQPWEILLSESQERMLCAVRPEHVSAVQALLDQFEIPHSCIGRVNGTGRFICVYRNAICVDLPCAMLTDEAPLYHWPLADRSDYLARFHKVNASSSLTLAEPAPATAPPSEQVANDAPHRELRLRLSGHRQQIAEQLDARLRSDKRTLAEILTPENISVIRDTLLLPAYCGRQPLFEHYCATVQGQTVAAAGALMESAAAVVRLPAHAQMSPGAAQGVAFAGGCHERWVEIDPLEGAAHSAAAVARKITATGGIPRAMTDCLNFGSPRDPFVMRQISDAIDGLNRVARDMRIPVVSGNVSLNNQTDGKAIPPTPMIAIAGDVDDVRTVIPSRFTPGSRRSAPRRAAICALVPKAIANHARYSLSETALLWGGSNEGPVPPFDPSLEQALTHGLQQLHTTHALLVARPIGRGGLFTTLCRLALESHCHWQASEKVLACPAHELFAEGQTGYLFATEHPLQIEGEHLNDFERALPGGVQVIPCGLLLPLEAHEHLTKVAGIQIPVATWNRKLDAFFSHLDSSSTLTSGGARTPEMGGH
jgi:phosphoribosylformylglycinamidine (FGAM) synthase-like enzyme